YVAVATMSDTALGSVTPAWASSSALLNIAADGSATAGDPGSNLTVRLTANFTRNYVSKTATQTVSILNLGPAAILSQPQNLAGSAGSPNATSRVVATGNPPLSYQWLFDGTPIPDATASSYTVPNPQQVNAGVYTVVVSNPGRSVTSSSARLT